ncbi:MAG TPA: complex I NDUFA9 subunit family protein [Allosphingosinicella sp.]|nr:complex I NDUFA9 subunit family protein [Allosphingosinicella sp.]
MPPKTDILVTVFGAGGFLGRYVAQSLLKTGVRIRAAERDPRRAWYLKPLGGLGQVQFVRADITDRAAVAAAVQGSDAVVNLVGILKGPFQKIHVDGARNVAGAAAAAGVPALVHISAIGADPEAESNYGRTKGEGEQAVRAAFPGATIIRPSIAFGQEDDFINRFARMARLLPILPVIRPSWKLQPVHAADLGKAIALAALDPKNHAGQTYELGGPNVLTMAELNRWICETTLHRRAIAELPDPVGKAIARLTSWAPGAPLTWDQWLMMQRDNVASGPGFEAFGLHPAPLAAVAPAWLVPFRRHGRFAKA